MAESEKMAALKKAYAEMILNTAKEAATRIMASENIAIRCKHDLFAAKDEALRLLVRLKQMIDAKIIEADVASSRQQSKIDELEAQLQEAEDVIIDLREELNGVRGKLEKARRYRIQTFADQNTRPKPGILDPDLGLQPGTTSEAKHKSFGHRISDNKHCDTEQNEKLDVTPFRSHSPRIPKSTCIVVRKNDSEFCRNGFTQTIRALEGNVLAGKLSSSGEADDYSIVMSDLTVQENDKGDAKFTLPDLKPKNSEAVKDSFVDELSRHVRVKVRTLRRTRFGKPKAKWKSYHGRHVKSYQQTSISRFKRYLLDMTSVPDNHSYAFFPIKTNNVDVNKELNELEEKEESKVSMHDNHLYALNHQSSFFVDENIISHERKRQREVQSLDPISTSLLSYPEQHETFQSSSTLNCCKTRSFSLHGNTKSGIDRSKTTEHKVKPKLLPCLDPGLILMKSDVDPAFGFTNAKTSVNALNSGIASNTANKDKELEAVLVKQKCETAANSTLSCYESSCGMVNMPLIHSDLRYRKASKDVMVAESLVHSDSEDAQASGELKVSKCQFNNKRFLKYTFQRKCKKEALSSPDKNE